MGEDFEVDGWLEDAYELVTELDDEHDPFLSDADADADALISAGMGTDEDYGYFGGGDEW